MSFSQRQKILINLSIILMFLTIYGEGKSQIAAFFPEETGNIYIYKLDIVQVFKIH